MQAVAVVDADTITSQGEQAAAWLGGGDWDVGAIRQETDGESGH